MVSRSLATTAGTQDSIYPVSLGALPDRNQEPGKSDDRALSLQKFGHGQAQAVVPDRVRGRALSGSFGKGLPVYLPRLSPLRFAALGCGPKES